MGKIVELNPRPKEPDPPDEKPGRVVAVIINVLLLLGVVLIVGASWLTYRSMDDYTVFRVLIPGVVGGLICIVIASTLLSDAKSKQNKRKRT